MVKEQANIQTNEEISSIVDHLFRNEYGKIVSYLSGKFGTRHLDMAEDSVQEALYMAMTTWPFRTIPDNPSAWIFRTATNKMIDKLRRSNKSDSSHEIEDSDLGAHLPDFNNLDQELNDDLLQMMFACCHPTLSTEYQIILSLKILCGFGIKEIAASLMKSDAAIAKAYMRAKQKFIHENIKLEIPIGHEIESRLKVVLKIIYLLFNEGYKTSSGDNLYKLDLCLEALRLNQLLLDYKTTNTPNVNALKALILLHLSRFDSRTGLEGELITLEDQDRNLWNNDMISIGLSHLNISLEKGHYSEYHIQAAIAAVHCKAKSFESTNWSEILTLYDALLNLNSSPVTQLNRLIPLSKVQGLDVALEKLSEIESSGFFNNYYLFHVIKGHFEQEKGNGKLAGKCFSEALKLTKNSKEKQFLEDKISQLA